MTDPETPPPVPAQPVVLKEPKAIPPVLQATPPPLPTQGAGNIPEKWRGQFQAGENIVWQGRGHAPATRAKKRGFVSPVLMIAFSLFWMGVASRGGGIIWLFGLIFLYKGLKSFYELLNSEQERGGHDTSLNYTLTNKAAYISHGTGELERIEITPAMRITLDRNSVLFAVKRGRKGRPYGFANIDNAADVYAMMRGIERGAR
jgi:hypothetical protein